MGGETEGNVEKETGQNESKFLIWLVEGSDQDKQCMKGS